MSARAGDGGAGALAGQNRMNAAIARLRSAAWLGWQIDANWAESGVRNSCEILASTASRKRRVASTSVSSRMTCTC